MDLQDLIYDFDLNGYCRISGAIGQGCIESMLRCWQASYPKERLFDLSFGEGLPWNCLIDHESYYPFLRELLGGGFRLDHAFAVTEKFVSSGGSLHHHADMFDQGIFHVSHCGRLQVGLIGVSVALTDIPSGVGGFSCIPGSHKSYVRTPEYLFEVENNRHLRQIPQAAGDVIIFSEALTHGTYPTSNSLQRRSIFMRFVSGHIAYREPVSAFREQLPLTPNYQHHADEGRIGASALSERQSRIVSQVAFARGRIQHD